ncbi:MAG TPA: carbon monoxide dehydrogenase subunit G [Candidatus Dormibacteraeota bacterium]|nr:carbon monoxide dehydrogenase subunit G [Candidatus Dormibacteraeota bacterium]
MNLQWQGHEEIAAPKERVWAFINDPGSVANCVPDLVEANVVDTHHVDAVVKVGVGPVRGNFKLKIELDPQADGSRMNLKISGGGFGSVVDLVAGADVKAAGDASTVLDWSGSATMRGPIASIAGRVIDAQAQRVISTTFANVKARCSS